MGTQTWFLVFYALKMLQAFPRLVFYFANHKKRENKVFPTPAHAVNLQPQLKTWKYFSKQTTAGTLKFRQL
jgi:hypothetical protein